MWNSSKGILSNPFSWSGTIWNGRRSLKSESAAGDSTNVEKLKKIRTVFHEHGYNTGEVVIMTDIARRYSMMQRDDEAVFWFRRALDLSRSIGYAGMTCQLLGVMAAIERKMGRTSSPRPSWIP